MVQSKDRLERRRLIMQAAAQVIRTSGEAGLRVAEVARVAGLTTGAIYSHFDDREALIAAVRTRDFQQNYPQKIDSSVMETISMLEAHEPLSKSNKYRERLLSILSGEGRHAPWTWVRSAVAAEFDSDLRVLMRKTRMVRDDEIKPRIVEAQKRGTIAEDINPETLQDLLLAMTFGMAVVARDIASSPARIERLAALWQQILSGIEP